MFAANFLRSRMNAALNMVTTSSLTSVSGAILSCGAVTILASLSASAQVSLPPQTAEPATQTQPFGADTTKGGTNRFASVGAEEVGALTGLSPLFVDLQAEQARKLSDGDSLQAIKNKQRILFLHAKINQYLHTATLEVSSVLGRLNSGMAQIADRKAVISDERARMLRRNTTINLVSGGLTKIGGYTSALTPASLIPTNVLEVFDGAVQVGLSGANFKQQQSEKKLSRTKPSILVAFLSGNNDPVENFPANVWLYLNSTAGGKSRRAKLIDNWITTGRLSNSTNQKKRIANSQGSTVLRMDDLDDMSAMMSDLKSVVSSMEDALMQYSQALKTSYDDDPVF